MTALLTTYGHALWYTLEAMAPYLLFGFAIAGIISVFLSPARVERSLGGRSMWAVVKASCLGVPLPLCSCSVIPVAASLRRHGAGRGAVMAFLLSTPQTGVDSILVTYSLMGPVVALFRPLAAFITGLLGGFLTNLQPEPVAADGRMDVPAASCGNGTDAGGSAGATAPAWRRAWRHAAVQLPADIGGSMLVGILLAAGIVTFVPDRFLEGLAGGGPGVMLMMILIGIPLYVCATASVPIAAALVLKGVSPGAALVFLIAGPATNAATLSTLVRMLGRGAVAIYLLTVTVTAIAGGLVLDLLVSDLPIAAIGHQHEDASSVFRSLSAAVLLVLLARPLVLRYIPGRYKGAPS